MRAKLIGLLLTVAVGTPAAVVALRNDPDPPKQEQPAAQQAAPTTPQPVAFRPPEQLQGGGTVTVPGWPTPVSTTLNGSVTFVGGIPLYNQPPGVTFNVTLTYGSTYPGFQGWPINQTSWMGTFQPYPGIFWRLHTYCAGGAWFSAVVIPESWAQGWMAPMVVASNSPLRLQGTAKEIGAPITISE